MKNPFTTRGSTLKRTVILTVVSLAVLFGIGFFLYISIESSVVRINSTNAEAVEFAQQSDIAGIVRSSIQDRKNLVEDITALIPPLTGVESIEGRLEQAVSSLFVRPPDVLVGGATPLVGNESIRVVQFKIKGRLRIDNFDEVLRRLDQFPVLLEIKMANLDLGASVSQNEGEAVFDGVIFANKVGFK